MSLFDIFKPACKLCGVKGTDKVVSIPYHGIYGRTYTQWHYHEKCRQRILNDPLLYRHDTVDKAIEISDRIAEIQKERERELRRLEEHRNGQIAKIRKLKSY